MQRRGFLKGLLVAPVAAPAIVGVLAEYESPVWATESAPAPENNGAVAQLGPVQPPTGTILPFIGDPPAGYLPCDGADFSGVEFPALAAVLGKTQTPDLRAHTAAVTTGNHNHGMTAAWGPSVGRGDIIEPSNFNHSHTFNYHFQPYAYLIKT